MTEEEWGPIAAFLENAWKDEFDEARESAYHLALRHLEAADVTSAVVAIAGNRPLANLPTSAGGTYLPSAQTIAIETAKWQAIGTWEWAKIVLGRWLHEQTSAYARSNGTLIIPSDWFVADRRNDLGNFAMREHGSRAQAEKLVAYVDSWGISYLCAHGGDAYYEHEGRRRWAELTLLEATGAPVALAR